MSIEINNNEIILTRGDTVKEEIIFETDDSVPERIDITGASIFFSAKENISDTEYVINKEITTHIDAANGVSELVLTSEETDIPGGTYYCDMQITLADDTVYTFYPPYPKKTNLYGYLIIVDDVTR